MSLSRTIANSTWAEFIAGCVIFTLFVIWGLGACLLCFFSLYSGKSVKEVVRDIRSRRSPFSERSTSDLNKAEVHERGESTALAWSEPPSSGPVWEVPSAPPTWEIKQHEPQPLHIDAQAQDDQASGKISKLEQENQQLKQQLEEFLRRAPSSQAQPTPPLGTPPLRSPRELSTSVRPLTPPRSGINFTPPLSARGLPTVLPPPEAALGTSGSSGSLVLLDRNDSIASRGAEQPPPPDYAPPGVLLAKSGPLEDPNKVTASDQTAIARDDSIQMVRTIKIEDLQEATLVETATSARLMEAAAQPLPAIDTSERSIGIRGDAPPEYPLSPGASIRHMDTQTLASDLVEEDDDFASQPRRVETDLFDRTISAVLKSSPAPSEESV